MNILAKNIEYVLLSHNCVIVPSLGSFSTSLTPARWIEGERLFLPPVRSVHFDARVNFDPKSVFVHSLASTYHLSFEEADARCREMLEDFHRTMVTEGSVDFGSIGVFTLEEDMQITMASCECGIITPDFYGLDALHFMRLADRKKEEEDGKNRKNGRGRKSDKDQTAFIDSTVQEKNVTFPTDSKLLNKIINYCHKVAKAEGIKVRQSYAREIKGLKLAQRFRGKSHSKKKVAKADRRMRTIAGRLLRELLRQLPSDSTWREHLTLCLKFVNGELLDGHKIYSLHEPDVLCICKGKEHKKYEFGNYWCPLKISELK